MAIANSDHSYMELDPPEGFQALQATFSFNRRARPPPMDIYTGNNGDARVPLKQPKVQRRDSKGGLRGMFTRNKTEKAAVSPVLEEAPASVISERTMAVAIETRLPRSIDITRTNTATASIPATPATPATNGSRMNLRAKSVRSTKTAKPSPKSSRSSTKSSPRRPPRTSAAWDPPPLFQAYPQAIKHATLSASTLSADAILRMSNHKRNNSIRDEIAQTGNSDGVDQNGTAKRTDRAKSKHRRQISGSISKADWTQKIFVLVTSGYLLQYSGEGSFDRLPEKMLQLGRESVAFASDVIPGKHWVLQISQAMDADGTPASDSRSLLSRLAFRGADYRRTATSLLLVLNSAEDMDSWLAMVRREIEALGGKKHVSETGKPKPDDKVMQLKAQPSHRYLVNRDPDQFSNPPTPQLPSFGPPPWVKEKDDELQQRLEDAASAMIQPQSSIRPSTGHLSITNSITSHDGRQLDNLRDSSNRFSYVSSGQRTLITSQGSSPATSPTRDSAPSFDDTPKASTEDVRPRPNASAINERRRSMQTMQIPILDAQPSPKSYRHSAYGGPSRGARSYSPGTPNFSVPNSSSKRYSTMKSLNSDLPPLPATTTTFSSRQRDSILKGTRKPPPLALNVTRPLSPVNDSTSPKHAPKQAPVIVKHRNSTFEMIQQSKPAVIDILPRSPALSTPSPTRQSAPPRPNRLSSLMPLKSPELPHMDIKVPRRLSSMQALRDAQDSAKISIRAASKPLTQPLLPAEHLPESSISNTSRKMERDTPSPLPNLANTKTKMKRPISMQTPVPVKPAASINNGRASSLENNSSRFATGRTWHAPSNSLDEPATSGRPLAVTSTASSGTLNRGVISPAGPSPGALALLSPSFQRVKEQSANGRTLVNRRSMPTLVNGPPPAPPPNCALPPLPPPGHGTSLKSPVDIRGSMRL
ncbi:hypothetical protein EG329_001333 [Mollisiaceae sp. DMI_Dod_QoI]|nr:hypothetical protein EG329_001333 [Helotiales sp. DMI_Dod_QoI]